MADDGGEVWGHLLCTTETKSPIRLKKKTITIGRKSSCDVSFVTNHLISSNHCLISQDEDGKIWLTDTSTNGTIINGKHIKGEVQLQPATHDLTLCLINLSKPVTLKVQISHNDKIQLVRRKNQPDQDISYIFHILTSLKEEFDLDSTEEYNVDELTSTPVTKDTTNVAKRPLSEVSDDMQPDAKKTKQDTEGEQKCIGDDKKEKSRDTMGEALVCGICQDIFHDCLSLQPCMHSFCCSCYSQWMEKSNECPTCRLPVERMSRNHIVNNLVEAYLLDNPGKRRSPEEIAEMDARNKITKDMIQPRKKKRTFGHSSDDDATDESSHDESESDEEESSMNIEFTPTPVVASSFTSLFGFTPHSMRPSPILCRWCPGFQPTTASLSTTTGSQSTNVPQPVCPNGTSHLMCLCCMKPMPRLENLPQPQSGTPYAKGQKCGICSNFYCHLLWTCNRTACRGCLNEFQDLDFEACCLDKLVMNNRHESQILKNYLADKGWSIKDLLRKCLEKLDSKEYTTPVCVTNRELSSKFILCYHCGLKQFRDLAYQFRRDIPREELPAAVTSRPDCHWGKNCRTQTNTARPQHAIRFNHICDQTRFT